MKLSTNKARGFTLVELGIALVIVALVVSTFVFAVRKFDEDSDAILVKAAQAQLEQSISQASIRQDSPPNQVMNNFGFRTCITKIVRLNLGVRVGSMLSNTSSGAGCVTETAVDSAAAADPKLRFTCTATQCNIAFPQRSRSAVLDIAPSGRISVSGVGTVSGWETYRVTGGEIAKNP